MLQRFHGRVVAFEGDFRAQSGGRDCTELSSLVQALGATVRPKLDQAVSDVVLGRARKAGRVVKGARVRVFELDAFLQELSLTASELLTLVRGAERGRKALAMWNALRLAPPSLARVDLSGADLSEIHFPRELVLSGAILRGAQLRGSRFERVDLSRADLTEADLRGASFDYSNFDEACLRAARFENAVLRVGDFHQTDFRDAKFDGALIDNLAYARGKSPASGATAERYPFRGAMFTGADFGSARLENGFQCSDLSGADLSRAKVSGSWEGATLRGVTFGPGAAPLSFKGADLREATLNEADLCGCDLSEAKVDGADFRGADLSMARYSRDQSAAAIGLPLIEVPRRRWSAALTKLEKQLVLHHSALGFIVRCRVPNGLVEFAIDHHSWQTRVTGAVFLKAGGERRPLAVEMSKAPKLSEVMVSCAQALGATASVEAIEVAQPGLRAAAIRSNQKALEQLWTELLAPVEPSRSAMPHSTDAVLERLRGRFTDERALRVAADALLERGDVRGELMSLGLRARAGDRTAAERARTLLRVNERTLLGAFFKARGLRFSFELGLVRELRAETGSAPALHRLVGHPLTWVVGKLEVGNHARAVWEALSSLLPTLSLETLVVDPGPFSDLGRFESQVALERLGVRGTRVRDVRPLAAMPKLRSLDLAKTAVVDLAPLTQLKALETLDLSGLHLSSLQPLLTMRSLRRVDLTGVKSRDAKGLRALARLQPTSEVE